MVGVPGKLKVDSRRLHFRDMGGAMVEQDRGQGGIETRKVRDHLRQISGMAPFRVAYSNHLETVDHHHLVGEDSHSSGAQRGISAFDAQVRFVELAREVLQDVLIEDEHMGIGGNDRAHTCLNLLHSLAP